MKIKYVGFDKDGTLIDDFKEYAKDWGRIIKDEYGISSQDSERVFKDLAGVATVVQLSTVLKEHNINLSEEIVFQKAEEIALRLGQDSKANAFADILPMFKKLKEAGFMIFVSSGQREDVTKNDLNRTELIEYVDYFVGVRPQEPEFKKGLSHFKNIAEHFSIDFETFTNETVFSGDTFVDIDIAKESNMISIARSGTIAREKLTNHGADFVIDDFSNLPQLLETF